MTLLHLSSRFCSRPRWRWRRRSCVAFALVSFGAANAATISGVIERNGEFVRLADQPGAPLVSAVSRETHRHLDRLDTGDFLVGEGQLAGGRAVLRSIDTVGLKSLIGLWRTEGSELVQFADFKRMRTFRLKETNPEAGREADRKPSAEQAVPTLLPRAQLPQRRWTYALSPGERKKWAIFLYGDGDALVGVLEALDPAEASEAARISIQLLDPDTLLPAPAFVLTQVRGEPLRPLGDRP